MTFKLPLVAASIIALLISANANATTVDFGVFVENTAITDQFASLGVTFRGLEEGVEVPNVTAHFSSSTGAMFLSNCYPARCGERADVVEVNFISAADNVSWGLDSEGSLSITFNAYAADDSLLETFSASSNGGTVGFTAGGISRIEMLQPSDGWGWGFANLTFDAAAVAAPAVPVPTMSTYGIVLTILGLLLIASRRFQASGKRN
jgi:hypothetical protein